MTPVAVRVSPLACRALLPAALVALVACSGSAPPAADGAQANAQTGLAGGAQILAVSISPLTLFPTFDAGTHDYYVRCATGSNPATISITTPSGVLSSSVALVEDQQLALGSDYWLRCLPHDFPVLTVTTHPQVGAPTPGWYLLTNTAAATGESSFAMVLDTNGTPVWYQRGGLAMNLDSPATNTLSFMPAATSAFGTSATDSYTIQTLGASIPTTVMAVGSPSDGHELQTLPNGDHLLFTYVVTAGIDLTGLQSYGTNQTIGDCEIQEIAPDGTLVWSWLATDHIDPVQESLEPSTNTVNGVAIVDPFHFNSIDVDTTGNLLVSSRHMNAVFCVEKSSGTILWKMGGTTYSKDGAAYVRVTGDPETTFSMQHDARFQESGNVSMFDDHGAGSGVSRGVEYAIDHTAGTATVAWQFLGTAPSAYMGSLRRYSDGESVIGWGFAAPDLRALTEVNAAGADVLDVAFDSGNATYRAVKVPVGTLSVESLRAAAGE